MRRRLGREAIRAVRRIAAPLPGRPRMARNGLALGAMPVSIEGACLARGAPVHYRPSAQQLKGGDPVSNHQPRSTAAVTRIPAFAEIRA